MSDIHFNEKSKELLYSAKLSIEEAISYINDIKNPTLRKDAIKELKKSIVNIRSIATGLIND